MRSTLRHLIIKPSKDKYRENVENSKWEGIYMYKRFSIRETANLSREILEARWQWSNVFILLKEKNCQPRILYSAKLSFKNWEEIKSPQINKNWENFYLADMTYKKD